MNHLQSPTEPSSTQAPSGAQTEAAHESSTVNALTRRPNRAHAHAPPADAVAAALAPPACPENPMNQHHQPRLYLEPSVPSALEEENTVFQELRVIQSTMQSHLWPSLGPSVSSSLEQQSLSSDETPRALTDEEQAEAAAASSSTADVANGGAPAPDVRFILEGDEDEGSPPHSVAVAAGHSPRATSSHGGHHEQRAHFADDNDESKPLLLATTMPSGGDMLTPSSTSTTPRSSASALTPSHHELRGLMSSAAEDSNSTRQHQLASKFHVSRVPNSISPSQTVQSGSTSTASSCSPRPHQPEAHPNCWQWDFGNGHASGPQNLTDDL